MERTGLEIIKIFVMLPIVYCYVDILGISPTVGGH